MTTTTNRRDTQDFTAERNATNDARQAGAVAAGLLPELAEAVRQRAIELWVAGYRDEARALIQKHLVK